MVKMHGEFSEFINLRRYGLSQYANIMTTECGSIDRTIPFHQA